VYSLTNLLEKYAIQTVVEKGEGGAYLEGIIVMIEVLGIVLFAAGACLTMLRLPLPINVDLGEYRTIWMLGPVFMLVGGLLWWAS